MILPAAHKQGFPRWPWPWLSYGAREVWFWHQICRYYTVCHHVEAYTLGRLSIDGFSFERVAQSNQEWIFSKLDSGFQSLVRFRIPSAGFRIPKPRIPDFISRKFLDSGIRIPLHGATENSLARIKRRVSAKLLVASGLIIIIVIIMLMTMMMIITIENREAYHLVPESILLQTNNWDGEQSLVQSFELIYKI